MRKIRKLLILFTCGLLLSCNKQTDYSKFNCDKFQISYSDGFRIGSHCYPSQDNGNCSCESWFEIHHHNSDECFCQGFNDGRHNRKNKYPQSNDN